MLFHHCKAKLHPPVCAIILRIIQLNAGHGNQADSRRNPINHTIPAAPNQRLGRKFLIVNRIIILAWAKKILKGVHMRLLCNFPVLRLILKPVPECLAARHTRTDCPERVRQSPCAGRHAVRISGISVKPLIPAPAGNHTEKLLLRQQCRRISLLKPHDFQLVGIKLHPAGIMQHILHGHRWRNSLPHRLHVQFPGRRRYIANPAALYHGILHSGLHPQIKVAARVRPLHKCLYVTDRRPFLQQNFRFSHINNHALSTACKL